MTSIAKQGDEFDMQKEKGTELLLYVIAKLILESVLVQFSDSSVVKLKLHSHT